MDITDIKEMSIIERIHAMELLWDSLCDDEQSIDSPEWHETILNDRKQKSDSGEAEFLTLDQVRLRYQNWQQFMKVLALILSVVLLTACSNGMDVNRIQDEQSGLDALVITIPKIQNKGFVFLDTPDNTRVFTIDAYWEPSKYTLMFNGGYFEEGFSPSGLFKVNGKMIQETVSEKLSGFVALNKEGVLYVLARDENLEAYPSVIQSGPFVIDPGGQIGIKSQSERQAERTLVGITQDGSIVIVVTEPVTLYDVAHGIKKHLPTVERLLNLDGGPSTALKTSSHEILNKGPVRNYIALTKK